MPSTFDTISLAPENDFTADIVLPRCEPCGAEMTVTFFETQISPGSIESLHRYECGNCGGTSEQTRIQAVAR